MKLLLGLMWCLHWLPLPILGRIGKSVGTLLFALLPKRRNIALTNLRLCFPNLSSREHITLAKKNFQNYARSVLERSVLWWASEKRLKKLIRIDTPIPLNTLTDQPTILLCPHFVCLDVAGVAVMLHSTLCSIYTRQSNKTFDRALRKGRSRFRPVKLFSRHEGIKPILHAIQEGYPFFMLPDMDFGPKGSEFVPFFGIPAATLTAPARLAMTTHARIIPVIATFLPNYQGWSVRFYPPWEHDPNHDISNGTRHMNAFIEQRISEAPSEYFWVHKRFKTRPPGAPSLYQAATKP